VKFCSKTYSEDHGRSIYRPTGSLITKVRIRYQAQPGSGRRPGHSKIAHTSLPLLTSVIYRRDGSSHENYEKREIFLLFLRRPVKLKFFTRGLQPGLTELDATETAFSVWYAYSSFAGAQVPWLDL